MKWEEALQKPKMHHLAIRPLQTTLLSRLVPEGCNEWLLAVEAWTLRSVYHTEYAPVYLRYPPLYLHIHSCTRMLMSVCVQVFMGVSMHIYLYVCMYVYRKGGGVCMVLGNIVLTHKFYSQAFLSSSAPGRGKSAIEQLALKGKLL